MSIKFKVAEAENELKQLYDLRKKVFVGEDGYPQEAISSEYDRDAIHFIATKGDELVGCVSVILDGPKGMPIEKFIDLSSYKTDKIAEVQKLAIIPEDRKGIAGVGLMLLAYEFLKKSGTNKIFIFSLEKKAENVKLYERLGFRQIGKFKFYNIGNAIAMMMDLEEDSVYDKNKEKRELKEMFIARKLSETINSIINQAIK